MSRNKKHKVPLPEDMVVGPLVNLLQFKRTWLEASVMDEGVPELDSEEVDISYDDVRVVPPVEVIENAINREMVRNLFLQTFI